MAIESDHPDNRSAKDALREILANIKPFKLPEMEERLQHAKDTIEALPNEILMLAIPAPRLTVNTSEDPESDDDGGFSTIFTLETLGDSHRTAIFNFQDKYVLGILDESRQLRSPRRIVGQAINHNYDVRHLGMYLYITIPKVRT